MFNKLIELGLQKGFTDIEVVVSTNKSLSLSVYEGSVEDFKQSENSVIKVKGIYKNKMGSVSIENFDEKLTEKYINLLRNNLRAITVKEPVSIFAGSDSYLEVADNPFDFSSVPFEDKVNYLINLEKNIKENPLVRTVESSKYSESFGETTLINSKGLNLTKKHNYAMAYAVGVFGPDNDIQSAYEVFAVENFNEFDARSNADAILKIGLAKLGSNIPNSGSYNVVFSNEMMSDILGVFQSIFSGEAAYRHLTKLEGKEQTQIFGNNITLIDSPVHPDAYFKHSFDNEGVACYEKPIVENGVFKGFLHNLKTASIFKTTPTGNAFGGVSPANMYLKPGNISFEQMISTITDGIYITDLVGLHAGVNTVSGDFSLQASGFKIENGKITTGLKQMVVSSNFFTMMNQIENISNDFKFKIFPVGTSSVHVGKLQIAGK